jgi:hypothetical protein
MDSLPPEPSNEANHLLYRRQFILSSVKSHRLANGNHLHIGESYHLSAHRDLELTQVRSGRRSLTLAGFALDPAQPASGNQEILHRLLDTTSTLDDLFQAVDSLGGRWALIVEDENNISILNDATGQREVYYAFDQITGTTICASGSSLLADRLGLTMDEQAVAFINSRKVDDYEIYWMPGETSLYAKVSALLPNHCLSLNTGRTFRFWPKEPPASADLQDVLTECLQLLRGQIESARRRFPLAVPMTAGWDSRLMLALNKQNSTDLYAFTLAYPNLPIDSRDVCVPAKLLAKLGIDHSIIAYPTIIDESLKETYRRNNSSANNAYCGDIQALRENFPEERVCVTGDAAEIVKCYYQCSNSTSGPTPADELAKLSRLGRHLFVVRAFDKWLKDAEGTPVELLDLFCWEQMAGRWQAKVRAEYDIVQESFAPLNNRRLLNLMLGLNPALRRSPHFTLFAELIEALWPEVLSEPINPPEKVSRPRRILEAMKLTAILQFVPDSAKKKLKEVLS